MDLVLFRDAVEHICRIVRVISQPRGNMLLIGIGRFFSKVNRRAFICCVVWFSGGSGRQSLARIAAYICEYGVFQIEVSKNYRTQEFREDLKGLYQMTGIDNKATTFLFNDTQVVQESFLEIINNVLSSGEVPSLYKPEEFEEVDKAVRDYLTL